MLLTQQIALRPECAKLAPHVTGSRHFDWCLYRRKRRDRQWHDRRGLPAVSRSERHCVSAGRRDSGAPLHITEKRRYVQLFENGIRPCHGNYRRAERGQGQIRFHAAATASCQRAAASAPNPVSGAVSGEAAGAATGNRAAGPVGAIVGGAIGTATGTVTGTANMLTGGAPPPTCARGYVHYNGGCYPAR